MLLLPEVSLAPKTITWNLIHSETKKMRHSSKICALPHVARLTRGAKSSEDFIEQERRGL